MRVLLVCLFAMTLASFADAQDGRKPELIPGEAVEPELREHGHYLSKSGEVVHAPAHSEIGGPPDGATARCGDDTYSLSRSRSGTCSRHGGVAQWLR